MLDSSRFDGPSVRKLLGAVLPTASDLEAFCLDFFPDVAARFASGQNRVDRDNLLLQIADGDQLVAALATRNPRRFARYKLLLLSPQSSVTEAGKNPYRGLSAFQVEETDLFFGRDELTERLWHRFQVLYEQAGATRLLAVLGPSGSGKSSVARAGLLAELQTSPIPGPEPVQSIVFKPGDNPIGALAIKLMPPSHEPVTAAELSAQRDLADFLRKPNGRGEFDGLSQWAVNRPSVERSPFVVLVDQLEEIYRLCTDEKERDAFVSVTEASFVRGKLALLAQASRALTRARVLCRTAQRLVMLLCSGASRRSERERAPSASHALLRPEWMRHAIRAQSRLGAAVRALSAGLRPAGARNEA